MTYVRFYPALAAVAAVALSACASSSATSLAASPGEDASVAAEAPLSPPTLSAGVLAASGNAILRGGGTGVGSPLAPPTTGAGQLVTGLVGATSAFTPLLAFDGTPGAFLNPAITRVAGVSAPAAALVSSVTPATGFTQTVNTVAGAVGRTPQPGNDGSSGGNAAMPPSLPGSVPLNNLVSRLPTVGSGLSLTGRGP